MIVEYLNEKNEVVVLDVGIMVEIKTDFERKGVRLNITERGKAFEILTMSPMKTTAMIDNHSGNNFSIVAVKRDGVL